MHSRPWRCNTALRLFTQPRPPRWMLAIALFALAAPAFAAPDLGPEFQDGSFGLALRPPRDWQLLRERVVAQSGLTILRMVRDLPRGGRQEFAVRLSQTQKDLSVEGALDEFSEALKKDLAGAQVVRREIRPARGLPTGHLAMRMSLDGQEMQLLTCVVKARPNQYFVMLYNGLLADQGEMTSLFEAVAASIRLLDTPESDQAAQRALSAGSDWLQSLKPERLVALQPSETWFLIQQGAEPVGYLQTVVQRDTSARRDEIALYEQGWTFRQDGVAIRVFNEMRLTTDLRTESWRLARLTLMPKAGEEPARVDVAAFNGARQERRLISEQRFGATGAAEPNPPIDLPPSYIPRVLVRLAPRLLGDLQRPRMVGFHEFDHERRGLVPRMIELRPETAQSKLGRTLYRLVEREGVHVPISEAFVTDDGMVLKVIAGPLVSRQARKSELEGRFAERVAAAEKTLLELDHDYGSYQERFRDLRPGAPIGAAPR